MTIQRRFNFVRVKWLVAEWLVATVVAAIPALCSHALTERAVNTGLVWAIILLVPTEFVRQSVMRKSRRIAREQMETEPATLVDALVENVASEEERRRLTKQDRRSSLWMMPSFSRKFQLSASGNGPLVLVGVVIIVIAVVRYLPRLIIFIRER